MEALLDNQLDICVAGAASEDRGATRAQSTGWLLSVVYYDGIICFGGADWWYHNRGHYDIQMCRQFSRQVPVLYVNSIGVRTPSLSEGGMFFRRVFRKLKSWSRGYRQIDDHFAVLSLTTVPGRLGRFLSRRLVLRQIRRASDRMGIVAPILWVESPTAQPLLQDIDHVALVYQRTDRYEEFTGVDRGQIVAHDEALKADATITLFCSTFLFEAEKEGCRAFLVDHGVDFERFASAGNTHEDPLDMASLMRPRAGFVGGIDSHTFDADLFLAVARKLPDVTFVLVGGSSLPEGWCTEPNVEMLGRKDYLEVPEYMAACDVLIMPWNQNEWIKACNPVKLKEYLAVGRPIVTTPFEELKRYEGLVEIASLPIDFAAAIRSAIEDGGDPESRRNRVREETWRSKADLISARLRTDGLAARPNPKDGAY